MICCDRKQGFWILKKNLMIETKIILFKTIEGRILIKLLISSLTFLLRYTNIRYLILPTAFNERCYDSSKQTFYKIQDQFLDTLIPDIWSPKKTPQKIRHDFNCFSWIIEFYRSFPKHFDFSFWQHFCVLLLLFLTICFQSP